MKNLSRLLLSCAMALTITAPAFAGDVAAKLKELVIADLEANNLIGLSAAIIMPDGSEYTYAAGVTDPVTKTPLTPKDLMLAGSVGKVLYASVTLQLAQEGVLDLDAPISKYIGDVSWFKRIPNGADITLRTLMNHTTGIRRHVMAEDFLTFYNSENQKNPDFEMTLEEVLHYALDKDPLFPVGERMSYADTNYLFMEYIVEKVTGRDFYDLIAERVTTPLGIKQVVPSNSRTIKGLTTGNLAKDNLWGIDAPTNKFENGELRNNPAIEGAGGGFAGTPLGLARLAKGLYEKRLISDDMYAQKMDTVVMGEGKGFRIGYGLGVMTYDVKLGNAIGHSGFFPGYRTDMYYFPKEKIAVTVMINSTAPVRLTQMAFGLADKIMKSEGIRAEEKN